MVIRDVARYNAIKRIYKTSVFKKQRVSGTEAGSDAYRVWSGVERLPRRLTASYEYNEYYRDAGEFRGRRTLFDATLATSIR